MIYFLSILWLLKTAKTALFYIFLWQLKFYRAKRFLDHLLRTEKGRGLILNKITGLKILLLIFSFFVFFLRRERGGELFVYIFLTFFLLLYFAEDFAVLRHIARKTLKMPVFTKKAIALIALAFLLAVLILWFLIFFERDPVNFASWLLVFDIIFPFLIFLLVFFLRPFSDLLKNQIIKKAKKKIRAYPNLLVVGISGSYGKTTTKEILCEIISQKFSVLKTKENQNTDIGIAQCVLGELGPGQEVFVVEMGAYDKGGIKKSADIVNPKIGILTGINEQHIALFGSQENIVSTKFELIEGLPEEGTAVLNMNCEFIKTKFNLSKDSLKVKNRRLVSPNEELDVWARDIVEEPSSVEFNGLSKEGDFAHFKIGLLGGRQIVENTLLAIACAKELGMSFQEIADACLEIKQEKSPIKRAVYKGLNILDSSYSANPDGVVADLEYLKMYPGRKIVIMPCLIELGKAAKEVHRRIGRKIGEICSLAIISSKDYFAQIKAGALESNMEERNIILAQSSQDIVGNLLMFAVSGDTVLLEGRLPQGTIELLRER